MVKSGLKYDYGLGFWGPNGHDGVWHIALARSLASGSIEMPIFAGELIKNYHVGFDLLLALINKTTGISISTLYFQILPPLLALGTGVLVYRFVIKWKNSKIAALWALFFIYFGGNFGWLITLIRNQDLGGESVFWSQQAMSTLINPPFALSLLILMLGLNLLLRLTPKSNWIFYFLLSATFGVLLSIKVYAGVLLLTALFIVSLFEIIRFRNLDLTKIFTSALIISLVLFLPFNLNASRLLELKPFWFLETMMSFPDRVGWTRFGDAMVNYKNGGVFLKTVATYFLAFIIFIVGNFGTRAIAKAYFLKKLNIKNIDRFDLLLFLILIGGIFGSMLFVQRGTAWNTIQFFYYSLFFGSIFGGIGVAELLNSKFIKNKKLVGSMIVLLTIPTSLATLRHYIPQRPPAMIPNYELEALNFLESQPRGIVLVMPFDRSAAEAAVANPPRPLYLYESTAYVSAYSGQPTWLEDEVNLDITGYDWQSRRKKLLVLSESNFGELKKFLCEENISYVYAIDTQLKNGDLGVDIIFENDKVFIFHTSCYN